MRLDFQRADRFQQRCFKRPVDCHDLAGRFHLGAQFPIGADKLVERPAGKFQHDIVDCRFKAGLGFAGHGVLNLVQPIADGDLGRDLGDRIAGRFGRQGAGTADPRIDFDNDIVGALGVERELHVAAAFHAKLADDRQRGRTQHLVFVVGKCLRRGDDDAVAGMYADRVDVFHVADHDTIVGCVTDDFVLDFLPTGHAALDQHLRDHAVGQAAVDHLVELFFAVDDTAAGTAQGIRRSDDQRITDFAGELPRSLDSFDNITDRNRLVDFLHRLFEQFAVFGFLNRLQRSAQQFYVIFFQGTPFRQLNGQIQADLAAQCGEESIRPLFGDDFFQIFRQQWLHIDPVGDIGVGHDRCRVGVDQHDLHTFFLQGAAGLGAGVVEFGRLSDHDRT